MAKKKKTDDDNQADGQAAGVKDAADGDAIGSPKYRNRIVRHDMARAGDLLPNPRNWRMHGDDQRAALTGVLEEIGYVDSVKVRETPDGLMLLDGHLRTDIAADEMIPITIVDVDDLEADKVLATFDPISAMAETNNELLAELMAEIEFESEALAKLVDDVIADGAKGTAKIEVVEDEAPEPPAKPITKVGDVWQMGRHRLICGSSTEQPTWSALRIAALRKQTVCFTSPPYNLGASMTLRGNDKLDSNAYDEHDDAMSPDGWRELCDAMLDRAVANCEIACFNVQPLAGNRQAIWRWIADRADYRDVITWDKQHAAPAMAPGVVNSRFEWLVFFGGSKPFSRRIPMSTWRGTVANVYSAPPQRNNEFAAVHGATFPVHLPAFIIQDVCDAAKAVVDCCAGTGTTMIAAEQLDRDSYSIELSPAYCDVIVERWQNMTGGKAKRNTAKRSTPKKKAAKKKTASKKRTTSK